MIECICSFEEEYGFLKSETMIVISELIRCKDCKYWSKQYRWCGFNDTDVELDDFCSRAERKEE